MDNLKSEIESNPEFGKSVEIDISNMSMPENGFRNVISISNEPCTYGTRVYCINTDKKHAYNVTLQVVSHGISGGTFQTVKTNAAGGSIFLSCTAAQGYTYSWSVIGEEEI